MYVYMYIVFVFLYVFVHEYVYVNMDVVCMRILWYMCNSEYACMACSP